jgi:hypothetical protein
VIICSLSLIMLLHAAWPSSVHLFLTCIICAASNHIQQQAAVVASLKTCAVTAIYDCADSYCASAEWPGMLLNMFTSGDQVAAFAVCR